MALISTRCMVVLVLCTRRKSPFSVADLFAFRTLKVRPVQSVLLVRVSVLCTRD